MQLTRLYSRHFQNYEKRRKVRVRLFSTGVLKLWEVKRQLELCIVLSHHRLNIPVLFDSYAKRYTGEPRLYPCTRRPGVLRDSVLSHQRPMGVLASYFISLLLEL